MKVGWIIHPTFFVFLTLLIIYYLYRIQLTAVFIIHNEGSPTMDKTYIRVFFKDILDKYQDVQFALTVTQLATKLSNQDLIEVLSGPL